MGNVKKYKKLVSSLIEEIALIGAKPDSPIQKQVIRDEPGGHYLLFSNGWRNDERVYGCFLHIDVTEDGKIWIQHDGTDLVVAQMLLDRNVPKKDIVLAFHAPYVREDTGFATA